MAKKIETSKELTVEDKLKALYELQQVASRIDELRILAGELPQEVKDTGDDLILYTCTYGGAKRITVRCSYSD
jgi:hypothetical protein